MKRRTAKNETKFKVLLHIDIYIYILDTCVKENTKILFSFVIYWEF